MKLWWLVVVPALLVASACGKTSYCSGTSCSCPAGATCAFDGCDTATAGCNYACAEDSTCTGLCGTGCNVSCDGVLCTLTVGGSSNVSCGAGSCRITCNGACTVSAADGGTADVTCRGGTKTATGCL